MNIPFPGGPEELDEPSPRHQTQKVYPNYDRINSVTETAPLVRWVLWCATVIILAFVIGVLW